MSLRVWIIQMATAAASSGVVLLAAGWLAKRLIDQKLQEGFAKLERKLDIDAHSKQVAILRLDRSRAASARRIYKKLNMFHGILASGTTQAAKDPYAVIPVTERWTTDLNDGLHNVCKAYYYRSLDLPAEFRHRFCDWLGCAKLLVADLKALDDQAQESKSYSEIGSCLVAANERGVVTQRTALADKYYEESKPIWRAFLKELRELSQPEIGGMTN